MKKKKRLVKAVIFIAIVLILVLVTRKTDLISTITGVTSSNEADSSTVNYYHFDIRVNGLYELSDGTTGTATVNTIAAVNKTTDDIIALSVSNTLTQDENSSDTVYEYKSLVGHTQNENLGLTSNDTITIDLIFTYGSVTQEITLEYKLDDDNNLCGGTKGTETYGYDIEIDLQDYINEAIDQEIPTYEYTINYFYNGVQDTSETITGESAEGLTITYTEKDKNGTYTLDETATTNTAMVISSTGENVLNIYYISEDTAMVIAYYYLYDAENDVKTTIELADSESQTGSVGDSYSTTQKTISGYTYVTTDGNTSGKMTEDTIIVYYYYKIDDVTLSNEITKTSDITVLTDEDGAITYTIKYNLSISDYTGTADVTIVDTLPYSIDENNSDLDDGIYDSETNTITWTESITISSSYNSTITKTITLLYEDIDVTTDIENNVEGITTIYYPETYSLNPGGERETVSDTDLYSIEQQYIISKTVKKTWNDTNTNHRPSSVTINLFADGNTAYDYNENEIEAVQLSDDNEWSYTFNNLPKYDLNGDEINYTVEESETEDGDLEYYSDAEYTYGTDYIEIVNNYTLKDVELDSEITKTSTSKITSSSDEVTYNINYTATISEYTGNAILTVVDTLPYAIDEDKSSLDGGTYNSNDNTITWEVEINDIDEEYEVTFSKTIIVVYGENLDASVSSIENNVQGTLYLVKDGSTNVVEDSATTEVSIPATVIVKYLDIDTLEEVAEEVEITGTPGDDYETEKKTVTGYTFVKTNGVATDGTMTEDTITVIYYYTPTSATITVNYYLYDENQGGYTTEKVADSITITDKVYGDEYVTEQKDITNYTYVTTTGDSTSGTVQSEEIVVNYYYQKIPAKVYVYYYLYDNGYTTTEVASGETNSGYVGDAYTTNQKDIEGYNFVESTDNTTGEYEEDDIIVIYYYEKITTTVTVNYYLYDEEQGGYTTIKLADSIVETKAYGDEYETEQKDITNYTYVTTTGDNISGTVLEDEIEVNYYYTLNEAAVVAKYVDEEGNTLADPETVTGHVGDEYTTEEKTIYGYTLVTVEGDEEGTMVEGTTEVVYIYTKSTATVVVSHYLYDGGYTTTKLAGSETIEGYVGDSYTTSANQDILDTYEFVTSTDNTAGEFDETVIYVNYYYQKISASVHVTYVDVDTGKEIADDETIEGYVGDSYQTEKKSIDYYVLTSTSSNTSGTYEKDTIEVIYYYRKAKFNMSIDKSISSITKNGTTTDEDSTLERVEVGQNYTSSTTISVIYKIVVTNTEEVAGTATIIDFIPQYFTVSSSNPSYWTENSDGNLTTAVYLDAGESVELTVVLDWIQGSSNFGTTTNIAQIISTTNAPGYDETTDSDNSSTSQIVLSVATGLDTAKEILPLILLILIALAGILGGVKLQKKSKSVKRK